jgi:ABC-2 type transport system ATP-binding protein
MLSIPSENPVLSAQNVYKSFGRNSVLKGVDLELSRGKLYGIVGENGSGKTTILNILAGFSKASKGVVRINGKTGFCPQASYIYLNLTVTENINLFSLAYGLNKKANRKYFDEYKKTLITTFNLSGYEHILCSKLSEGTRQKLNIIISLLNDPDLLLLDEPYSSLDWDTYLRFWEYSGNLIDNGKTILIVSHLIYDKSKICRIWELKNGILV